MQEKIAARMIFVFLLFAIATCNAQTTAAPEALSPELTRRIQQEVRSRYSVPAQVDISVSSLDAASGIPGYDKVVITFRHDEKVNTFDFLLSKDRKTLARFEKIDVSQDLMSKIDMKGRPIRGGENAKVTVVVFDDLQCPFCARMHSTLFPDLLAEYGDKVKFVYKDYPLTEIHPWAMHAAVDANCLADQNSKAYWGFIDYVHANAKTLSGHSPAEAFANLDKTAMEQGQNSNLDTQKLNACIQKSDETAVRSSMAEGEKLGLDSAPTLFVNGERITGAIPQAELQLSLNRALTDAGEKPPAAAKN